eukprot:Lithocolla_globosa_v1_NODE_5845_length_1176_cov_154.438894.p1 type:complete len:310 gc:universal NODE_5845_length_1176_cov_154.438894:148-1077(+)
MRALWLLGMASCCLGLPLCVAHRGASADYAENSLTAFREAEKVGSHGIELDLLLTRDLVVIVHHDLLLDRTTNCTGEVQTQNWRGHMEFCVLDNGEPIPRLHDILDLVSQATDPDFFALLDLKGSRVEMVDHICSMVSQYDADLAHRLYYGGWTQAFLDRALLTCPTVGRSLISSTVPDLPFEGVQNFNLNHVATADSPQFLLNISETDQTVYVWTVNEQDDMEQLSDLGVDGILTDLPVLCLETLGHEVRRNTLPEGVLILAIALPSVAFLALVMYFVSRRRSRSHSRFENENENVLHEKEEYGTTDR